MSLTIRVDIPALDDLVEYLRDRDGAQPKIDHLQTAVSGLTARLQQSSQKLAQTQEGEKQNG